MQSESLQSPATPQQRRRREPQEWKVVSLRECPSPESMTQIGNPQDAVDYWNQHIACAVQFNPDCECVAVLILNTRMRIQGHHIVSVGSLNEALAYPREVFRIAIMACAHSIVLMHNHPSGETIPSDSDCRLTRHIRESGEILRIQLQDHIIVGHNRYFSFKESGLL